MRAVFEVMGITDIVAKSLGSTNPYNVVRATLDALKQLDDPGRGGGQARQVGRRALRLNSCGEPHVTTGRRMTRQARQAAWRAPAKTHRDTVRGLGLRGSTAQRTVEDTPSVRGMIKKVAYLVRSSK